MRRVQKQELLDCINTLYEAQEEIMDLLRRGEADAARAMLGECMEFARSIAGNIRSLEGEDHAAAARVEDYCGALSHARDMISDGSGGEEKSLYRLLKKALIGAENGVKNEIRARFEVAFFPYKASMWDSLESVYLAAKADPRCDVYCVPIPYYDLNPDHSFGKMHYEGFSYPAGVEVTDYGAYCFEDRRPDVIYIHNPFDDMNYVTSVPKRFYSDNLKKYTDKLVYIPYFTTMGKMGEIRKSLPAYDNADYIVIQSPALKQYFDPDIPDGKFLELGSPKFDRVLKKCKNPPKPPEGWAEKMAGRKVFFYNTSLNGMLRGTVDDTASFLKKLRYVISCFEGREDVCLLWRPHPLMEFTLRTMRAGQYEEYLEIRDAFLESGNGIYDTTSDVDDAVALSDAYLGESGSSIVTLFEAAGKPVFILAPRICEKPGEDAWKANVNPDLACWERSRADLMGGNEFAVSWTNELYVSEPYRYDYHFFCRLSEERNVRRYGEVYEIGGRKYVCPRNAQDILVVGEKGITKRIPLRQHVPNGFGAFNGAWKFGRYLLLLPVRYPALVRYDTETGETRYYEKAAELCFRDDTEGEGCGRMQGGSWIQDGFLYFASPTDNRVYRLDIAGGKESVLELPIQSRCGCGGIVGFGDEFWMLPVHGYTVVRWNPKTGETREYDMSAEGFHSIHCLQKYECSFWPLLSVAFYEGYAYFTPDWGNKYLKLEIGTGNVSEWRPPYRETEANSYFLSREGLACSSFIDFVPWQGGEWFRIYSWSDRRLYRLNLRTMEYREIEVRFDLDEIRKNEVGFEKIPNTNVYCCRETVFNSLPAFLDGRIFGKPFDRKEQLRRMERVAVNLDGSCGEKVHEYITGRGAAG